MADDPYYAKLDRLDEQARKEREEMLERHGKELAERDRQLSERKLAFDDHYDQIEKLRETQAQQNRETLDRLFVESEARRGRGPDGPDAPLGAANSNSEEAGMAEKAAEQSRQDMATSRFAAQFAADQAAAQALEVQKQREIEATIGGIDDPEMASYLVEQQREIEEKYAEQQRERDAREEHERNARRGDLQPVSRAQADKAEQEKLDRELAKIVKAAEEQLVKEQARAEREIKDETERAIHLVEIKKSIREAEERAKQQAREEAERRRIRNYEYTRD